MERGLAAVPTQTVVRNFPAPAQPSATNAVTPEPLRRAPEPSRLQAPPKLASSPGTSAVQLEKEHFPRPVQDWLEAQVALARLAISPGSIDGLVGPQTRAALRAFQHAHSLTPSGELDAATRAALVLDTPVYTHAVVSADDLSRLQPVSPSWLGKSRQPALEYESLLELLAEKSQAHPSLIRRLNPATDWTRVSPETRIVVPCVNRSVPSEKAAFVRIRLAERSLQAFGSQSNLLAHFPCSIARMVEKRPLGELRVVVVISNPNYTFDPELFPESPEARSLSNKLVIPPGPNNPVGVAWIGLDRPGYGIHGTPSPEQVGRTESHGCFRLANWNAALLVELAWVGMPVYVEP
ncbi:MAG TPA: L,D-transpeptidase [Candidatus Paceibacterota bacterium]|nr:L,D-transpeptidase [Candidatus Paceibacterota bacterium]